MKVLKKEKLFANSSYKRLFISSTAASFGDLFDMFAVITLFTYVWHANSLWITLIPVAYALPSILLSQAAGNLADRYDKVQLMFLSELIRLLFTSLLFFTTEPLLALGVLTLRSMSSVMKVPAQTARLRSRSGQRRAAASGLYFTKHYVSNCQSCGAVSRSRRADDYNAKSMHFS